MEKDTNKRQSIIQPWYPPKPETNLEKRLKAEVAEFVEECQTETKN